jgi:hypothetical protein
MGDLVQQVLGHVDPATLQAMAARLGVDPAQAETAIRQAVPLIVGGMAKNASTDAGAAALHEAAADHAGVDIGSVIGSVLGGGGEGGAIIGHVFGSRQDQAAQSLGQASGIGAQNASALLAMLAPVIMGVLAHRTRAQGTGAGGLGGALGAELQQLGHGAYGGLLTSVLDRDGDGQLGIGDLLKAGSDFLASRSRA